MRARGPVHVAQAAPADDPNRDAPSGDTAPTTAPDADAPAPAAPAAAPPEATLTEDELLKLSEAEAKSEVIVVTGSTLDRRELTTAAPVTVLDRQDLEGAGLTTVGNIIQKAPDQSGGINAQTNNGNTGGTRVDIRGLGANRTLVLLNGRRFVAGGVGADSSVDINSIPLAVIERVEILKDGASAVYGSDAIGGVVNIITRDDFQGTDVALYTGETTHHDGFTYDASFVTGHSSNKGNILFSAGWQKQGPVWAGDRSFSNSAYNYDFMNPDPAMRVTPTGSLNTPNGRIGPKGIDWNGDGKPDGNGMLCGASACKPDGMGGWAPFVQPDDLYNDKPLNYLYTPSQRYNVFSTGHYNLSKHANAFFEGLYVNRQSDEQLAEDVFTSSVPISGQSIYNPLHATVYDFRRRMTEFGPRHRNQNIDTFRFVTGLAGKTPEDAPVFGNWKWELSYNYGHTSAVQHREGHLILSRLANALGPSFTDADGVAKCGTPGNVIPGCVPLNIMGPAGSIDPAARDYVAYVSSPTGTNFQRTGLAQIGGRVVKLPANGDISFAAGADYRVEGGDSTPDPYTAAGDSTAPAISPTSGKYNVAEAFSELSIVPVSGQRLAEWTELSLAARTFRYNTFGSGTTWKAGGLFKTIGGVAVRGTYSTAFRAPNVAELYSGQGVSFPKANDPCSTDTNGDGISDGPSANPVTAKRCAEQGVPSDAVFGTTQQQAIGGGNPKLQPETARVLTAGVVIEPPVAKGLSLTVDYFRIKIDNTIADVGIQVILNDCYLRDDAKACSLIERNPASHDISLIHDETNNIGSTTTRGVDFALAYDYKAPWGRFRNQLEGVYLMKYETDDTLTKLEGVGYYDLGAFPRLKANLTSFFQFGGSTAGVNVRYIGGFKECMNDNCNDPTNLAMYSRSVSRNVTADVFAGYRVKTAGGTTTLTVGVNNVADQKPALIYQGFQGNSDAATYDYMGRFIYTRLSQLF